jgi:hypothetical protein
VNSKGLLIAVSVNGKGIQDPGYVALLNEIFKNLATQESIFYKWDMIPSWRLTKENFDYLKRVRVINFFLVWSGIMAGMGALTVTLFDLPVNQIDPHLMTLKFLAIAVSFLAVVLLLLLSLKFRTLAACFHFWKFSKTKLMAPLIKGMSVFIFLGFYLYQGIIYLNIIGDKSEVKTSSVDIEGTKGICRKFQLEPQASKFLYCNSSLSNINSTKAKVVLGQGHLGIPWVKQFTPLD